MSEKRISLTLYAAQSIDGFIARADGDSDWVSDSSAFDAAIESAGCIIVGRKTYEQYSVPNCSPDEALYPVPDTTNIVISSKEIEGVEHIAESAQDALAKAAEQGHTQAVVVGGSTTWDSFISAGLFDELIIETESIMLGSGMRITTSESTPSTNLKLEDSKIGSNGNLTSRYTPK
jgi:dihydrofolate reductase